MTTLISAHCFPWVFVAITGFFVASCGNSTGEKIDYPDEQSAAAKIYIEKCGTCHVAPHPNVHTKSSWPSVLTRMQLRAKTKHGKPLERKDMSIIFGYLQRHAKP